VIAFGARRLALGVWRLAFGVWRSALGARRLAFGVWRSALGEGRICEPVLNDVAGLDWTMNKKNNEIPIIRKIWD
jgi:hypothetical protein